MDEIVEKLKDIGLNSYEAKVYIALLKKYPATGYEISKIADIPQARAYDTLKALETQHIVISSGDKPVTYSPIKPKELTKRYKRKVDSTIDFLEKKLPDVKENYSEPILTIDGRAKIINKVIEIIKNAKKNIFLEIWSQDFKFIESYLLDAYNRGLDIKIVGYDNFNSNFGTVFKNDSIRITEHYTGERFIFMTADNEEGIFGKIEPKKHENADAVWSKNHEIVFLIKSFIARDMYLIDIENHFPEQLKYFYGAGLKKLRDKILF